jgi:uncharacterized protein GlcG (DUF336 family)
MSISMSGAMAMIEGAFAHATAQGYAPMQAIVVDVGGNVLAFLKQDGSSIMRFEQCHGKACAALSVGPGHSRRLRDIATDDPAQFEFLTRVSPHPLSPVGGGYRVLDDQGKVLGAMAVAGDTSGNDEAAARAGIRAAGFTIAEE